MIMQNQNETVKDVLLKVLNEIKGGKESKQISEVLENSTIYVTSNDKIKKKDKEDLLAAIDDLTKQLDTQAILMEKLKTENESIKSELAEKKANLAHCLDVLEENHSNLNNLSGNIDVIITEKETYLKEIEELKSTIEKNDMMLQQKDKEIRELKDKLNSTDQKLETVLTEENKDLRRTLNKCEQDLQNMQKDYAKTIEVCNIQNCNQLAKAILDDESLYCIRKNVNNLQTNPPLNKKIDQVDKESNTDGDEKKIVSDQYEYEITLLNEKIINLEQTLEQTKLVTNDYEKQNKYYSQKVDSLVMHLQTLEKENSAIKNNESEDIERLKKDYDDEINELKHEIDVLKTNYQEKGSKDKVRLMKGSFEATDQERAKLIEEKEYLKDQLNNLQKELTHIQQEDEKQILSLQEKIDNLESAENEKRKEIEECCCVVNNIKETIADKNLVEENNFVQISLLEDQNQKLREQKDNLQAELQKFQEIYKGCTCMTDKYEAEVTKVKSMNGKLQTDIKELEVEVCRRECLNEKLQNDIKEMEIEICRRQCTIDHLEQCLDKSNKILAECEKEIKEIHSENESVKNENESLRNELKDYILETERSSKENNALQEKVTAITRQSQDLELEKYQLSKSLQDKSNIEDELNLLKKQYNILMATTEKKDQELREAKKQIESLQHMLEESDKEYDKIMKAYKDVRETLSDEIKKFNKEAEKINTNKDDIKVDLKQEPKCTACLNVRELAAIVAEKEKTIKVLESQNHDLASEGAQLKEYVNRLISDNKNLRRAIENLLTTLVEKLRNLTENEENISLKSNEMIVKDILNSLVDLEKDVGAQSSTSLGKCNCMSVITSKYKISEAEVKSQHMPNCRLKCGKKIKDMSKHASSSIISSKGMMNICADCCDETIEKDE